MISLDNWHFMRGSEAEGWPTKACVIQACTQASSIVFKQEFYQGVTKADPWDQLNVFFFFFRFKRCLCSVKLFNYKCTLMR